MQTWEFKSLLIFPYVVRKYNYYIILLTQLGLIFGISNNVNLILYINVNGKGQSCPCLG